MEEDDIDLGQVEHPEGHEGAEGHGDSQCGGLDEHLWKTVGRKLFFLEVAVLWPPDIKP